MADVDFKSILEKLKDEAVHLALTTFKDYKTEAKTDALKLLDELKVSLERWTLLFADGKLTKADFEFLVLGQKELVEMNALKQAGLTLIKTDEFKNSLLKLITTTIAGLI